jgi:predicted Zn-dependent protease
MFFARQRRNRQIFVTMAASLLLTFLPLSANAVGLLRDADIEYALDQLAKPILSAAGLSPASVKVLVVDDTSLNAFVVSRTNIFIHSGLLMRTTTPEMIQAVIAHEAAHIANGHFARRIQNIQSANSRAALGALIAIAAGAATGNGQPAAGVAIGIKSAAMRGFLAHTRSEESSADKSALAYLKNAGISGQGMRETMSLFVGQEALSQSRQDAYVRSHPLSRDRIRAIDATIAAVPRPATDPTAHYWHARAVAKLSAFMRSPTTTLRAAQKTHTADIGQMMSAIALSQQGKLDAALVELAKAQAARPGDAYLQDLRAELLMRNRQFKNAASEYAKAATMDPNNALILAGLGRAQLAAGQLKSALKSLEKARDLDDRNAALLRDLGQAYAQSGNAAMASLAAAERYALQGRIKDAKLHAKRAAATLPRGAPSWQRAEDVLSLKE